MGTVRKIGDEYFIEFFARGLKYQQKIGPDRKLAEQALSDVEAKIAQGEAALLVRDVDWDIFFYDFREFIQDKHTPKTIQRYQSVLENFTAYLQREHPLIPKLSGITPFVIEQYKAYLLRIPRTGGTINPSVLNLTLLLLRDIFQYAITLGYLNDNPTLHIGFVPQGPIVRISILMEEESLVVSKSIPQDLSFVVEFMLLTGIRVRELIPLRWEHMDWPNHRLWISSGFSPGKGDRSVPMDLRTQTLLENLRRRKAVSPFIFLDQNHQKWHLRDLQTKLNRVLKTCPISKTITLMSLRHTFAARCVQKGVAFPSLYKILGETDVAKMMIYLGFLPDGLNDNTFQSL